MWEWVKVYVSEIERMAMTKGRVMGRMMGMRWVRRMELWMGWRKLVKGRRRSMETNAS